MKTINIKTINVFKVLFPDGRVAFELKSDDGRGSCGYSSVRSMAENVKGEVANFLRNQDNMVQFSIDLRPYHDIECPVGLAPRRCLPLTDDEANEFWNQFNS